MNKNLRRLWIISFINCLCFLINPSAGGGFGATIEASPLPAQCIFDPSGYFYTKEPLPQAFADFAYIKLWRSGKNDAENLNQSLVSRSGENYRFTESRLRGAFEFHTAAINQVRYAFTGKWRYPCIFEEFDALNQSPNGIACEGVLSKSVNGVKVAETSVQLTYSAKSPGLKNDVNEPYPSGRTDLFYAVRRADLTAIRALLDKGAKVNIRDLEGQTALAFAIREVPQRPIALTIVRILIAAGADVNLKDNRESSPLHTAVYGFEDKRCELVKVLLAAGGDANAGDEYGTTVLMHAVHGASQVKELIGNVRQLLHAGAQVNARNKLGQTGLSIAMESGNGDLINLLKQAGAKP
jgi:uncharacterized protein